ncbi:hypothetical protein L1987_33991 [Smallanthus sonchifolius]|uniref:Uncharacterized protein n=1 Tax=Smallanthus sonchifolius TaxID=185202 RepID=A0ACB9HRW6_9ASTR|nr:hypothetical protein L1987_33991 [Smallanthus sonchifolius]
MERKQHRRLLDVMTQINPSLNRSSRNCYEIYFQKKGWRFEEVEATDSSMKGFKDGIRREAIASILKETPKMPFIVQLARTLLNSVAYSIATRCRCSA